MAKKRFCPGRRDFLKISAAGSAGMIISGLMPEKSRAGTPAMAASGWEDNMQINPLIDNLRASFCYDPEMTTGNPVDWTIEGQNDLVNAERVAQNLDKMAIALAEPDVTDAGDLASNARDAWSIIFQKPEGKNWSEVTAAIKVNCIWPQNMTRLAVIDKVARELVHLGVLAANIFIYDQCHGHDGGQDYLSSYSRERLPPGVNFAFSRDTEANAKLTVLPDGEQVSCWAPLVDREIDILVNTAVNKGQSSDVGNITLCLKNHLGTMRFSHSNVPESVEQTLISMNQSEEILGGTPPVQQLCILDSLWAMTSGPTGQEPNRNPNALLMGIFAPAMDWLTVHRIREESDQPWGMGMASGDHRLSFLEGVMLAFGYDPQSSQLQQLDFIDALSFEPTQVTSVKDKRTLTGISMKENIKVLLPGRSLPGELNFKIAENERPRNLRIFNMEGRTVHTWRFSFLDNKDLNLCWDGRNENGKELPPGKYIVSLDVGQQVRSMTLTMIR
jgi:hypothetical protein